MLNNRSSTIGILFGLLAGASWGLAFLIPNMLSTFSSLDITLGRYFMYGLYSLFIFLLYKKNPFDISITIWSRAFFFAFLGNVGFYFFLATGIQNAGATVATLIAGILPVSISFFGNLINKEFPFKLLAVPACLILVGVLLLNVNEFGSLRDVSNAHDKFTFGLLCCFVALALWTWYGISNANFLKKETQISSDLFATIVGIQTFTIVVVFLIICRFLDRNIIGELIVQDRFVHYLIGVMILGVVASWVGAWAWNQTSVRLPVTLAGMVIVFETIFGLLYTYIYQLKFPTVWEWFSMILIVSGVTLALWRVGQYKQVHSNS